MVQETKPCKICKKITDKMVWDFCETCNLIDLNKTLKPYPGYYVNKRLVRNNAFHDLTIFLKKDE